MKKFNQLPIEYQDHIKSVIKIKNHYISKQKHIELQSFDKFLTEYLKEDQKVFFKNCVEIAYDQNTCSRAFIHFRKILAEQGRVIERIYIQMNTNHVIELVNEVINRLYGHNSFGVIDIKVACPQCAGRADGLVIYIGDEEKLQPIDEKARKYATKKSKQVLGVLKDIQKEFPHFFGHSHLLLKKKEALGIATIPNLSDSDSFTEKLSLAIYNALIDDTVSPDNFKDKIINNYLEYNALLNGY